MPKRASQSTQEVYKERLKAPQKNKKGQQETTPLPLPKPNQSTKSTMERGLETMNNLDHT